MSELQLRRPGALGTRHERSYVEADVEIRVLGPLEVTSAGADVHLGGRKQRTVLALLAAEVGKPVTVDALIDVSVAVINGVVNGDVIARERVELGPSAVIHGNISTPALSMKPGATFQGDCRMLSRDE